MFIPSLLPGCIYNVQTFLNKSYVQALGINSINAYCIAHLWDGFIASSFKTHLGLNVFKLFGETSAPMLQGVAVLLVFWLILFWM